MTRDRAASLRRTLIRLIDLPSRPPIIVVDNGSTDGSPEMVRSDFPAVRLLALNHNRGVAARNLGIAMASTDLVAFSDDDSWWEDGALQRVGAEFEGSPRLGLVAAAIRVGQAGSLDDACRLMETSPLGTDLRGRPRILGFLACGAVVRREAICQVGGFDESLFFVGEEEALALDLARRGWDLVYVPEVVSVHMPSSRREPSTTRQRMEARNRILTGLTRRSVGSVIRMVPSELVPMSWPGWSGVGRAFVRSPSALLRRRVLPIEIERQKRLVERGNGSAVRASL